MFPLPATRRAFLHGAACLPLMSFDARAQTPALRKTYGLSSFGDLGLPENFKNFPYVRVDAPKGGQLLMETVANSYDSLNGYVLQGNPAVGLSLISDSLMVGSLDEDNTVYGLVAETVEIAPEKNFYRFFLRKTAHFHDGTPLTAPDVAFSLNILSQKGHPLIRQLLRDLGEVKAEAPDVVTVALKPDFGRDSILNIVGQPIFSEKFFATRDFSRAGMDVPLGSGAYKIGAFEQGRYMSYERVKDYWAKDLPVNLGQNNFDAIRYDYFGERAIGFEAFKAGTVNLHESATASEWATGYDFPAARDGRVVRMEIPDRRSPGFQGFFFNLRRPVFQDARIREALGLCLDFEWDNKNLFYGAYKRQVSFFENTDMMAFGVPGPEELAILEPLRAKLPPEVFGEVFIPPVSDGSGQDRALLRRANELLQQAGCRRENGKLLLPSGAPLAFEFLETTSTFEKVVQPMFKTMALLGIEGRMRTVDAAQYKQRLDNFDFDMIVDRKMISGVPGDEILAYFGSASGKTPGGLNYAGLDDPAVDALLDRALKAQSRAELVVACRALDRVLRAQKLWIPNWFSPNRRVAAWNIFGRPEAVPKLDLGIMSLWWQDPEKAAAMKARG